MVPPRFSADMSISVSSPLDESHQAADSAASLILIWAMQ